MMKKISRFLSGTLRGRLIISVALVHAVMMSVFIIDLVARQRSILLNQQIGEAVALSQTLATSTAGWLASNDVAGLQELVDAQLHYPEILFIILGDKEGRVLAGTDRTKLGQYMLDLPSENELTILSSTYSLVDVVVPVMLGGNHVGWARVGIGQEATIRKLEEITRNGIIYTLMAIFSGGIIAWFMGGRISQRLYAVQKTMDAVRSGNRLARSRLNGTDEAAVMAREFNSMLDMLEERDVELRASEERYRSLIQKVQVAIVLHDREGRILTSNPLAQRLLGRLNDPLLGKELDDPKWHFLREDGSIMPADEYPASRVIASQQSLRDYVAGISHAEQDNPAWVLVNAEPDFNEAGTIEQIIVSFVDITERKLAEKELQEREEHSQSLLRLSRKLEQAQGYDQVLNAARDEIKTVIGYQSLWVYLLTEDKRYFKALIVGDASLDDVVLEDGVAMLPIQGDRLLEEIVSANEIVVVEDAQSDERVNKEIVARLKNRTIINIPIILFDKHLGTIGTGSFGDEGVRVPSDSEQIYLAALARHMASALDRIHLLVERKQTEKALRESEEKYRILSETSTDIIITQDLDGRITYVNQSGSWLTEYREVDLIGTNIATILPPEELVEMNKRRNARRQGDTATFSYETRLITKSGKYIPVEVHSTPIIKEDRSIEVLINARDITERKQAEQALHTSALYARSLIEASLDPLVTISPDGKITDVNEATVQVTDVPRQDIIGSDFSNYFTEPAKARDGYRKVLADGLVRDYPLSIRHKSGRVTDVLYNATVYKNEAGEIQGVFAAARDITEQKRVEEALRASEERWRTIVENAPECIKLLDRHGRLLDMNSAGLAMIQAAAPQVLGKAAVGLVAEEDRNAFNEMVDAVFQGETRHLVFDMIGLEGRRLTLETISVPLMMAAEPDGGVKALLGVTRDITEQKRAEAEIKALARFPHENPNPVLRVTRDGSLLYANPASEDLTLCWNCSVGEKLPEIWCNLVQEALGLGLLKEAETTCKERIFSLTFSPIVEGGYVNIYGNDITERKLADEKVARSLEAEKRALEISEILREANESLSRTLNLDEVLENLLEYLSRLVPYDSANVMVFETDFQLRVIAMRNYEHWTDAGKTRELLLDLRQLPHLNDAVAMRKSILIANTYDLPRWVHYPGTEHVISWLGIPIIADGQVIGLYSVDKNEAGFFTDEHRRLAEGVAAQAAVAIQNARLHDQIKHANTELEQRVLDRTAQLESANKELEAFAYSVSHDLRAPLRHIDGFIELLQKRTQTTLDEQSRHYMDVIADAAKRMGTLIDDLLSFSRMGRSEMFKSQVDFDELVRDVIREFKPEAEGRDIQWKIAPLPTITGDRAMLRSVLVNLITNALKFTRPRKTAQIEIGCEKKSSGEVVIFIRDNGVGFDMDYADKLFGVFQRLHRQEDFDGTGIGLANVRRIVSRHGGRTWAEGQVDHGATFYFSLPILK